MFAYLRGKVAELESTHVVIDCQGVGYLARISLHSYGKLVLGEESKLHTHLQVREDAHVLFGFTDVRERQLFEQLIAISGVGANTALMILSSLSPDELFQAIRSGDNLSLQRIKGIGAKTAARIILELKDKVQLDGGATPAFSAPGDKNKLRNDALAALMGLGMPRAAMEKRVDAIIAEQPAGLSVEQLVKLALRNV